jgi:phosphoglycolate phosphatase
MKNKIKAIIFDLDGTIADTFHIGLSVANELSEKYNYEPIKDSPVIRDLSFKEFLISHLKLGKIKLFLWAREVRRLLSKRHKDIKIFPEIKETLEELKKNYSFGILTSNSTKNTLNILKNNDIEHLFSFIYTNCAAFSKWRYLRKIQKKEHLNKDEIIYIGDEIRDVESCNKAQIPIIAVSWGANSTKILKEEGANYYAYRPWDIVNILKTVEEEKS